MTDDPLLTVDEVASRLSLSTATVWKMLRAGELPARRIGRTYRIVPTELEAWLDSRTAAPSGSAELERV
ncbi:MAG TPA: helix-turn-helix domain-containing protein [Solirubrobacteraceae bacterium]|jgi:excisionase family DNA binding protein|nr:helix-turn-helix domain-containing protein [Solirubrobacteraceae bacterium]